MKFFICDDNFESFFTAFFDAYREENPYLTSDKNIQLTLGCETVRVRVDDNKCGRVVRGLLRIDGDAVNDIITALKSSENKKFQIAFLYAKSIFKRAKKISSAYNLTETVEFNNLLYKVTGEAHRLKGFLRFTETADGVFYAPYSPDNDITEMLMPHFSERFKTQKFVIHDIKRKIAGLYNGAEWIMIDAEETEIRPSENELAFKNLWKKYYRTVNIEERLHEKQMKGYMPVRYWKFLPEKNENL